METNNPGRNRSNFIATAVIVGLVATSVVSAPAYAMGLGDFIGGIVNQVKLAAGNGSATSTGQANGYNGIPIDGKIEKSVVNSDGFTAVQSWLDQNLKRHPNGQVRIVVTPKVWTCNHIQYATLGEQGFGWQCSSTNNISIYFSRESGIGEWVNWKKSPQELQDEVSGPALKADGGIGDGKTNSYQMSFSTGLTMMASNPIDYETTSSRTGPKLPENHNWLPNNILNKKAGFTGNSNGYLSIARMFGRACNDVEASLSLQNHSQTLCWVN